MKQWPTITPKERAQLIVDGHKVRESSSFEPALKPFGEYVWVELYGQNLLHRKQLYRVFRKLEGQPNRDKKPR